MNLENNKKKKHINKPLAPGSTSAEIHQEMGRCSFLLANFCFLENNSKTRYVKTLGLRDWGDGSIGKSLVVQA